MEKINLFYPDTSYIYGGFKSKAHEFKNKKNLLKYWKPKLPIFADASQELINKKVRFLISELTEFEIKKNLVLLEGMSFDEANTIFLNRLNECPIYVKKVCFKEILFSQAFFNETIKNELELNDALHMLVAAKLSLAIITKENKKFACWKKAYDKVMTPKEFQEHLKKI